jgi:MYXO-CTERM domain-containing protein
MRRILLAALLAGSAWTVHAEPTSWTFGWTGFQSTLTIIERKGNTTVTTVTEEFLPNAAFGGRFTGEDLDGDGIIGLSELTYLNYQGDDHLTCGPRDGAVRSCTLDSFRFDLDGELSFSAGYSGHDADSSWDGYVTTGVSSRSSGSDATRDFTRISLWTPETRFRISVLPVPEPATGAMALAGLMLLAGLRRRVRC